MHLEYKNAFASVRAIQWKSGVFSETNIFKLQYVNELQAESRMPKEMSDIYTLINASRLTAVNTKIIIGWVF